MKSKVKTGDKYAMLTVLGLGKGNAKSKKYWLCKCACGNLTNVETSKLGKTQSCGCLKQTTTKLRDDLTGKVFEHLTVLSYAYTKKGRAYWKCRCFCGAIIVKQGKLLKMGSVTSCGCQHGKKRIIDLTNRVFGKLTVIKQVGSKRNSPLWECLCACGNMSLVTSRSLLSGNTKSCGCSHHRPAKNRKDLTGLRFGKLTVIQHSYTEKKKAYWLCQCDCGNKINVYSSYLIQGETKSCGCVSNFSFEEKEVVSFVKSIYKGEVIENDRSLIAPKELDIYIPGKNFAIEYDGLAWHSERTGCKSSYHLQKTRACNGKGVRLFHLYSNEWRDKKEIVKSMISSALGVYERKIYARKCDVREVTDRTAVKDMLNGNHLQGDCGRFSRAMGLYYKGELVQLCVFGTQHFGRKDTVELYRMVTLKNTQVVGGFSRLMEHSGYSEVMSYVSLRTFNASGYYSSGWTLESISQPSYCYTDGLDTYSRQLFKKDKCLKRFDNVTEDMTETEMTEKNGFYKLWDCGTYKVSWKKS